MLHCPAVITDSELTTMKMIHWAVRPSTINLTSHCHLCITAFNVFDVEYYLRFHSVIEYWYRVQYLNAFNFYTLLCNCEFKFQTVIITENSCQNKTNRPTIVLHLPQMTLKMQWSQDFWSSSCFLFSALKKTNEGGGCKEQTFNDGTCSVWHWFQFLLYSRNIHMKITNHKLFICFYISKELWN